MMELKKCPEGHYYDVSVYSECPTCRAARAGGNSAISKNGATEAFGNFGFGNFGTNISFGEEAGAGVYGRSGDPDEGQTIAMVHQEFGFNPVVGWLVALNGSGRGIDYAIHAENNYIGRSEKMDICIHGDETISRVNHAILAYDPREKAFYFARGEGRSLVRVNGKAVLGTVEIQAYDTVEIGQTRLIFIPLCGERFDWEDDAK